MPTPRRDPREPGSVSLPAWVPALAAGLFILATGGMTTYLALEFEALRPGVGDMIVFAPSHGQGDTWQITVSTADVSGRDQSAGPCVFDPNTMSVDGGSLVIESRRDAAPPRFLLHWAGQHTAAGQGDCGSAADVTLDRYDLQRLANAAGGFGVRPTALR